MRDINYGFFSKIEKDLLIIHVSSITLILSTVFDQLYVLRLLLSLPFLVFFPGYIILKIFYSKNEINSFERLALSIGISMVFTPLIGLILAYSPLKITLYPFIFLIYLSMVILSIMAQYNPKYFIKRIDINPSLSEINVLLVLILISIIGLIVRFYPIIDYSLLCGNWIPGNHLYHVYYTLQTGELLKRGIIDTPTLFSSTIYNTIHNKANVLFQILIFTNLGVKSINELLWLNKFFPYFGAFIFPLVVLAVTSKIIKGKKNFISYHYIILIYLTATFSSYQLLIGSSFMTNNAIIGLSMMLFTIYFLLSSDNVKKRSFGLIFGIFTFLYYYTSGLVLLILLFVFFIIQRITKERLISENYILLYCTSFISYYMYMAVIVFDSYVTTLKEAVLNPGITATQATKGRELVEFSIPHLSAYINILLIGLFLLIFICLWFKKDIKRDLYTNFNVYLCFGLIIVGLLLFLWRGPKGAIRLGVYGVIPFLLGLPILIKTEKRKLKLISIAFSLLVVVTSVVAYLPGTVTHSNYLDEPEKSAIIWYTGRNVSEEFVFTDSRIGTSPVLLNNFKFVGLSGNVKRHPYESKYLQDIYYGKNPLNASEAVIEYRGSYILLSEEMKEYGVSTLHDAYKPISSDDLIKYKRSDLFVEIYNNEGAYLHGVRRQIQ